MRIAHLGVEIVPSGNGAFVGGLVKNVATLGAAQVGRGHEVHIFTTDVRGRLFDGQALSYGRVHRIRTAGEYGSLLFAATFLAGAAREIRRVHRDTAFDLIHVHSAYASLGLVASSLRRLGVPLAFSLYSPNFRGRPGHDCNGSQTIVGRTLSRRSLRSFGATIVPSRNLQSRVVRLGLAADRVSRIPPAVDPSMFEALPTREESRRRLGLPADAPIVLFLGNYSPWKGVENLLRAMGEVHRGRPDALLVTAWGEPYEWVGNRRTEVLTLIHSLSLDSSVHQVGIVDDVRVLLRAADLLVSPFECTCKVLDYPLSILEAMACERPVISTAVGGIPEVLDGGERGVAVAPKEPGRLAEAILGLLRDPRKAEAIGMNGAQWARENARPAAVVAALDSLYEDLCRRGESHGPGRRTNRS